MFIKGVAPQYNGLCSLYSIIWLIWGPIDGWQISPLGIVSIGVVGWMMEVEPHISGDRWGTLLSYIARMSEWENITGAKQQLIICSVLTLLVSKVKVSEFHSVTSWKLVSKFLPMIHSIITDYVWQGERRRTMDKVSVEQLGHAMIRSWGREQPCCGSCNL